MDDYSLVPVDHQPDFEDVSLVPVEHDPFGADGTTRQQPATQPERLEIRNDLPDIDPIRQFSAGNKVADNAGGDITDASRLAPPVAASSDSPKSGSLQQYSMASHAQVR